MHLFVRCQPVQRCVQADVLVNVIASSTPNLAKAGAVSACLLQRAGPALQRVSYCDVVYTFYMHARCITHGSDSPLWLHIQYNDSYTFRLCSACQHFSGADSVAELPPLETMHVLHVRGFADPWTQTRELLKYSFSAIRATAARFVTFFYFLGTTAEIL